MHELRSARFCFPHAGHFRGIVQLQRPPISLSWLFPFIEEFELCFQNPAPMMLFLGLSFFSAKSKMQDRMFFMQQERAEKLPADYYTSLFTDCKYPPGRNRGETSVMPAFFQKRHHVFAARSRKYSPSCGHCSMELLCLCDKQF